MTGPSITDGVPGLEARHTLTPPDPWPSFTLNDHEDPTTGLTSLPCTRLQRISGLHDKPDADDPRVNLVNRIGEQAFPRQQRGKTITYSGVAVGRSLSEMRSLIAAMRAACASAVSDPGSWGLSIAYDETYDPIGLVFTAKGVPVGFTSDDVQGSPDSSPTPWQRSFDLSFRLAEPRFWLPDHVRQIGYYGGVFNGIADGVDGTLHMTGTAPSEPRFEIEPSSYPLTLTHNDLSRKLTIKDPGTSPSTIFATFASRTVTDGSGNDITGFVDWTNTDWWGEAAAGNTMLIGDNSLNVAGGAWACKATPAVW